LQHFDRNYLINKKRIQIPKEILQEPNLTKIDETGKKILQIISNNASYLPNIIHSEEVFGGSDLEFNIECKNYSEFKRIIKKEYENEIENIKHYRTTKIIKTTYYSEE